MLAMVEELDRQKCRHSDHFYWSTGGGEDRLNFHADED